MAANQLSWADPKDYIGNALGVPVTVTSGYRTPQHNAAVGGVQHSDHLTGSAYDFVPQGMSMADAAAKLKSSGISTTKIINENDHIHVSYPKGDMSQQGDISDDQILAALRGGAASKPTVNAGPSQGDADISDAQILAALRGTSPAANPAQPASQQFPAGDSRNNPAAVTVRPDSASAVSTTPQAAQIGPVADSIRSLPGGLAKGVTSLLGMPGDVAQLGYQAGDYLGSLFDGKPTGQQPTPEPLPTTDRLNKLVSQPFGGYYEPKTTAGKYTDTIAQFAPAALAPGSALVRAGRVLVPGSVSEAAGQAATGTPYEGAARVGGAVLGAMAGGGIKNALTRAAQDAVPSTQEIKAAASAAYKRADQAGVVIKHDAVQGLGDKIDKAVTDAGIDPTLHPKAVAAVNRVLGSSGDITLKQMDILRRVANGAAGSMDKDESRIAHIVLDHIDDFVENLSAKDTLAGNTGEATSAIKDARSLWSKQAKSSTIDNLIDRAKNRSEVVSGSGLENALRVEFRGLAQNEKRMSRFSPEEQRAIRDVARGGAVSNFARTIGKLAPTNLISILGEMGAIAHDPKALAIPIAGTVGRVVATNMTKKAAKAASEIVRRGGKPSAVALIAPETLSAALARRSAGNALTDPNSSP